MQIRFAASMSETGGNNYSNSLIKSLTETEVAWATYQLATGTTDQALPLNMSTGVDSIHTFFLTSDQDISWRQVATDSSIPLEANGVHALGGTGLTQVLLTNNSGYTAVVQFGVAGPAILTSSPGLLPVASDNATAALSGVDVGGYYRTNADPAVVCVRTV